MADPDPFDGEQQQPACASYSYTEEQIKVLDELEAEARRLFPPSDTEYVYQDVNALKAAITNWSSSKGAHMCAYGKGFFCRRAPEPPSYQK
jgi:hypothetical protein